MDAWTGKCLTGARLNLFNAALAAADSLPLVVELDPGTNRNLLTWRALPGTSYRLEYSPNPATSSWTLLATGLTEGSFSDTTPENLARPTGFYRLSKEAKP